MLFGHNTNVTVGQTVYHVQTEDRGTANALIDTTVHCRGRVLHRRTNSYFDLLPLDADRELALKLRLDEQHRNVIEEIRSGVLQLSPPAIPAAPYIPPAVAPPQSPAISLELLNATSWLAGRRASLHLRVSRMSSGHPAPGARVSARVEGSAERSEFLGETSADGCTQIEFDMPRLSGEEIALVVEAIDGEARAQLRYQLRAKPKVPAAG